MMALSKGLGAAQAPPNREIHLNGPLVARSTFKLGGASPRELDVRYKFNVMLRSTEKAKDRVLVLRESRPRRYDFSTGLVLGREVAGGLRQHLVSQRGHAAKQFEVALKTATRVLGFAPPISSLERGVLQDSQLEYQFVDVPAPSAPDSESRDLKIIQARQSAQQVLDKARELVHDVDQALKLHNQMMSFADSKVMSIRDELRKGGHLERNLSDTSEEYEQIVQRAYKKVGLSPEGDDTLSSSFRIPVIQEAVNGIKVHYRSGLTLPWKLPRGTDPTPWELTYLLDFFYKNNGELVEFAPKEAVTPSGVPLPMPVEVAMALEAHVNARAERLGQKSNDVGPGGKAIKWPIPLREAQAWRWLIISWNWFHSSKIAGALGKDALVPLPKKLGWAASAPRSGSLAKVSSLQKQLDAAVSRVAVIAQETLAKASSSAEGAKSEERVGALEAQVASLTEELHALRATSPSPPETEKSEGDLKEQEPDGPFSLELPKMSLTFFPPGPEGLDAPKDGEVLMVCMKGGVEYYAYYRQDTIPEVKTQEPPKAPDPDLVPCSLCGNKIKVTNLEKHIEVCPLRKGKGPEKAPAPVVGKPAVKRSPTPGPKPKPVDPLLKPDPAHTSSVRGRGFNDLPEATQNVLRSHFKVERLSDEEFGLLSPLDKKLFLKENSVPRWATSLVLRDITNLSRIVTGEISSANASDWTSKQGAPKLGSRSQVQEAVEAWKGLKSRYQGTALLARPRSQKEKSLLKELNDLKAKYGKLDVFPTPRNGPSDNSRPSSQERGRSRSRRDPELNFDKIIQLMMLKMMSKG